MTVLQVYLQLYATCLRSALASVGKSAWTLLLPVGGALARTWIGRLAMPLGILGGLLTTFATAAIFSAYLYVLRELVQGSRVSPRELKASLGAYLWSVVNVFFVVWLASLALQMLLAGRPGGAGVLYAAWGVAVVAFNAAPEVIYLRGTYGGLQTVGASWDFLKRQWLPWFAANVPALAVLVLVDAYVQLPIVGGVVFGAVLHVVMVFRGLLFRELDRTTHRQRMFARRVA